MKDNKQNDGRGFVAEYAISALNQMARRFNALDNTLRMIGFGKDEGSARFHIEQSIREAKHYQDEIARFSNKGAIEPEVQALLDAHESLRNDVLNQVGYFADLPNDNDQVNYILGGIDDAFDDALVAFEKKGGTS